MMTRYEVRCINKANRYSKDEHIMRLGGVKDDGTNWNFTQEEVIQQIESGDYFYVNKGGKEVKVIVINPTSLLGSKYLKTVSDGISPNNLLSLPECTYQGLLAGLVHNNP